jgi:hypothetical protein
MRGSARRGHLSRERTARRERSRTSRVRNATDGREVHEILDRPAIFSETMGPVVSASGPPDRVVGGSSEGAKRLPDELPGSRLFDVSGHPQDPGPADPLHLQIRQSTSSPPPGQTPAGRASAGSRPPGGGRRAPAGQDDRPETGQAGESPDSGTKGGRHASHSAGSGGVLARHAHPSRFPLSGRSVARKGRGCSSTRSGRARCRPRARRAGCPSPSGRHARPG